MIPIEDLTDVTLAIEDTDEDDEDDEEDLTDVTNIELWYFCSIVQCSLQQFDFVICHRNKYRQKKYFKKNSLHLFLFAKPDWSALKSPH